MFLVTIEMTIVRRRVVPFQNSPCSELKEQSPGSRGSSDVLSTSEPKASGPRSSCQWSSPLLTVAKEDEQESVKEALISSFLQG